MKKPRGPAQLWHRVKAHEKVLAVSVATALMMSGQGMLGPVLPLYARRFGVGVTEIGVTVAAFALARLVFNVPTGLLADRWERRFLLVGGPVVVALTHVGAASADGITSLTLWRFGAGVGSAVFMTGSMAYVADVSTPENRARLLGLNQAALLVGVSVGPALGGLVAEYFGLVAPFYVIAAASLLAAIHAWYRLDESLPPAARPAAGSAHGSPPRGWSWLTTPAFVAVAFASLALFTTRGTTQNTLLPLVAAVDFGLSPGQIGWILTGMALINLVLLPTSSMLADRHDRRWVITPGLAGVGGALLVMAGAHTLAGLLVAAALVALATSVVGPGLAAFAADAAQAGKTGLAMGMFRTAGDLGLLLGPPAFRARPTRRGSLGALPPTGRWCWPPP